MPSSPNPSLNDAINEASIDVLRSTLNQLCELSSEANAFISKVLLNQVRSPSPSSSHRAQPYSSTTFPAIESWLSCSTPPLGAASGNAAASKKRKRFEETIELDEDLMEDYCDSPHDSGEHV